MIRARLRLLLTSIAVVGALFTSVRDASASTIVLATGSNGASTGFTGINGNTFGFGFSTAVDYTNVTIGITLASFNGSSTPTIDVYLTSQIGPGTTVANQFASATVTPTVNSTTGVIPYTLTPVTLLSGLNLSAGNYFVTFVSAASASTYVITETTPNLTTTTALGAAANSSATFLEFLGDPYPPAAGSQNRTGAGLWFSVDGTPVTTAAVPEPASLLLLASGLGLLAWGLRRARK